MKVACRWFCSQGGALQAIGWLVIGLCGLLQPLTEAAEPFPRELVAFRPADGNPVFSAAGEGHWDAKIRERGWIRVNPKAPTGQPAWRMWYTGYDGTREGVKKLGLATSNDGITWTRHPANPLAGDQWVEDMTIVADDDGTLWMFAEGRGDQAQLWKSNDGLQWNRVGPLDVRMLNGKPIEAGPYGTPTVFREDGNWYFFYERRDAGVWLAKSRDLKVWQHVQDEPVMSPGPDEYDRDLIAFNQVIKYQGRYYAYYHGSKAGTKLWATAIACSDDLVHWTKYAQNPLFPVSENKSSGILVHDGSQYRLYTMHDRVQLHMPRVP